MQSFWAILYLLGRISLPDSDTMVREIAEWNAWTTKRYLSQGQKFPYSLYDFLPVSLLFQAKSKSHRRYAKRNKYVDTLCKDLGINSRRKSNPVAEIFSPYGPGDFNGFIDEYFANQMKVSVSKPTTPPRLASVLGVFGVSIAFATILSFVAIMV